MTQQLHSPNPADAAASDVTATLASGDDQAAQHAKAKSIVDTVLNLDELMSAEVRRPARTAYIQTRPDLHARKDELVEELRAYVDERGNLVGDEAAASERDGAMVMTDLGAVQDELDAAKQKVIVEKMSTAAWTAFNEKFRDELDAERMTLDMRHALIVDSPTTPSIGETEYEWLNENLGDPAIVAISDAAWAANVATGADQGKSRLYSRVQRQRALAQS